MAVNRKPGEKMYIDWVGDQPGLLTDVTTGEIMRVHIFATTLGVSSMIYAEAFPNEKLPCFIEGCVHAVSFYGAVAKHFVPDNLKQLLRSIQKMILYYSQPSLIWKTSMIRLCSHHRLVSLRENQRSRIMCVSLKHIL